MRTIQIILLTAALILTTIGINAQEQQSKATDRDVIVELITGTVIEGSINEWVMGEYIDLHTAWVENLVIPSSAIKKVIQKSTMAVTRQQSYHFKDKGIYYSAKLQFIAGNEGQRAKSVNGLGMSFSAGHRYNRLIGVGAGIGYDRFIWNSGENFVPLFAEITSFFTPKNTSLFANIQAGYSFAFEDEEYLLTKAKGGFMVYPALGLTFGRYENKFTVDLGYKIQKAELTYRDSWSPASSEQRLTYRRLTFRIGILL